MEGQVPQEPLQPGRGTRLDEQVVTPAPPQALERRGSRSHHLDPALPTEPLTDAPRAFRDALARLGHGVGTRAAHQDVREPRGRGVAAGLAGLRLTPPEALVIVVAAVPIA